MYFMLCKKKCYCASRSVRKSYKNTISHLEKYATGENGLVSSPIACICSTEAQLQITEQH